jgi:hypothetical protein
MSRQLQSRFWFAIFIGSMICTAIPFSLPEIDVSAVGGQLGPCNASHIHLSGWCKPVEEESPCIDTQGWVQWHCKAGVVPHRQMAAQYYCQDPSCKQELWNKDVDCDYNEKGMVCD